jgi:class 3 adenylate cyclase/predicted ATPase
MTSAEDSKFSTILFEGFRFDCASRELFALDHSGTGVPVAIGARARDLLALLIDRHGKLVFKDEIMDAVWREVIVEEANLTVQIAALRRILDHHRKDGSCIQTVPGRGYRFVASVAAETPERVTAPPPRADAARDPAPMQPGEAERRQITAISCELVGASAGTEDLGLERLREAVGAFQRCAAETVARHNGFIFSHLGNTVLVVFGYPAAHEDDTEQAVRSGLELCTTVGNLRSGAGEPMQCRVGIATGMAIIGDHVEVGELRDREIIGDTPNLAARLQASAEPNMVAIEPVTRRLIGDLFDCRDLGVIEPNGGTAPMHRWRVLGERVVESRFEALHGSALSPLIGRDEEIDLLLRRWTRAKAGDGQVVLISGEPGIGKSRVTAALKERLDAEPYLRLRYFCSPYRQDSALYPFIDQLGRAAGFARDDVPAVKLEKLVALLARASPPGEDVALLADLLSLPASELHPLPNLSPQRKKEKTLEALIRQLEGLARQQPVVVVLEDAHWIDPTSRELLDLTVERVPCLPVLMIVTFRPEFQRPWTGQPQVSVLALNRLNRHDRTALATHIAGGKTLPDEVMTQIADRTDGVPLFIEELTRSVLESGLLREDAEHYALNGALPPVAIPTSLHASLLARLDRLASVRRVAQIGAAIGREFSHPIMQAVSRLPEDELQAALAQLVASELVFRRGAAPDAVYTFKHALVQDAAHDSLLRNTRRQLHAQIAEALETHSPELMDSQPELFAQHYAEAGLVEKSVACWGTAGHRSAARSAMAEAAAQFQKGLNQLALLPDSPERQRQELELLSALGPVLHAVKGPAGLETGQAYARARDLWEQLGSPSEFLQIPFGLSRHHGIRGELDPALRLDEDLLRLSRQRNDAAGLALGHLSAGRNLMLAGRLTLSRAHLEVGCTLSDPVSHHSLVHQAGIHPHVNSQAVLAITLFCLGFPDQALSRSNAAVAEARRLAHPPSLAVSMGFGSLLLSLVGDKTTLDKWAAPLAAVAREQDYRFYHSLGTIYRGWVEVQIGKVKEGISLLRSGLSAYRTTGGQVWLPHSIALLARACEIAGQVDEALAALDEALQISERIGERWFAAELYRHKGRLLLRQGPAETAEVLYRKALGVAREQEAKLWELRAALSLARLRRDQGHPADARDLLAPVYGWFTEGFDTPDLKEAKALLDEFS